jgi:DNA-directed RNA polymerase subunit E'/Rpb7
MFATAPQNHSISIEIPLETSGLGASVDLVESVRRILPSCRKDYGFLVDVLDAQQTGDAIIAHATGIVNVRVSAILSTILPKPNDVYHMCIMEIYRQGLFAEYLGVRVFVPEKWISPDLSIVTSVHIEEGAYLESLTSRTTVGNWIFVWVMHVEFTNRVYTVSGKMIPANPDSE